MNPSIYAKIWAQCLKCGYIHRYDGVYKRTGLITLKKEGLTENCSECEGHLMITRIKLVSVPGHPELDVHKTMQTGKYVEA